MEKARRLSRIVFPDEVLGIARRSFAIAVPGESWKVAKSESRVDDGRDRA